MVNQDRRSPLPIRDQKARYEKQGIGSNAVLMVGHEAVRSRVMGQRSTQAATDADITAMQAFVEEGNWVDLVIFDDTIADNATVTDLHKYPTGIPHVPGKVLSPRRNWRN